MADIFGENTIQDNIELQTETVVNIADPLKLDLDDETFVKVTTFSDYAGTPTGVLKMIKDIKGNEVSKRLFEIRTKKDAPK